MKARFVLILAGVMASVAAVVELVSCTEVRPLTPGSAWQKTAPEHLGLQYLKVKSELKALGKPMAASVIQRHGYLIWEQGEPGRPVKLPPSLAASLRHLEGGDPGRQLGKVFGEDSGLPGELSADMSARDLLRLGLFLLRNGRWNDEQIIGSDVVAALLDDRALWQPGTTRRRPTRYLAAGSRDHALLILLPQHDIAMAVVADPHTELAEPATYADIMAASFRLVW